MRMSNLSAGEKAYIRMLFKFFANDACTIDELIKKLEKLKSHEIQVKRYVGGKVYAER